MKKIACIGNITYDTFGYTKSFPKENERCDYFKISSSSGGPSFNAANVLEKFGSNVDFYGFIGDDDYSKLLKLKTKESNINYEHLETKNNFSMPFSYIIVTSDNKTRTINAYRDKEDNENLTFNSYDDSYDIILTDGKYPKAYLELKNKNKNAITIIDAGRCKEKIIEIAKETDYVIASEDFANDLVKHFNINYKINMNNYKETYAVMDFLRKYFKKSKVAVTIGKDGYLYFDEENNLIKKDALSFGKVLDTTAAGDIFHGAFTYAISKDMSYEEALEFANTTSSLSVTKFGGKNSIPKLEEVLNNNQKQKKLILKK